VGKSSIVNRLVGGDVLTTAAVREWDARGRHTSVHRQLLVSPTGGLIIDTPGMRELQPWDTDEGLGQTFQDVEGDTIPKEKMLMIDLADGRRIAVRPSGTEPKIKFYMYARRSPGEGKSFTSAELASIKAEVKASLERLWAWVQTDVESRLA